MWWTHTKWNYRFTTSTCCRKQTLQTPMVLIWHLHFKFSVTVSTNFCWFSSCLRYLDTVHAFNTEAGPSLLKYQVCDNVDLPTILQVPRHNPGEYNSVFINFFFKFIYFFIYIYLLVVLWVWKLTFITAMHTYPWISVLWLQEYEEYYFVKFKRNPKITKRQATSGKNMC